MTSRLRCLVAALALVLGSGTAHARPLYFDTFVALYGLRQGDNLYACGVCHRKWEGTGGRNPYGLAVEQQLYIGKMITDAILDVENEDTDLDGFTNRAEIRTFGTLPGYSCDNFDLVIDPPANFQSMITPNVASCLQPKDLLLKPGEVAFVTEVGRQNAQSIELVNNGTSFPITVSAVEIVQGDPSLTFSAPPLPIVIPVGSRAVVEITHTPVASQLVSARLRVTSDDPDEPVLEAAVSAVAVVLPSASPAEKAACFAAVDKQFRSYSKRHFKEWTRCFLDEVNGRACNTGRRDLKTQQAESRLRSYVGGSRDRSCAGSGMTPVLLGLPSTCGAPCGHVTVNSIAAFVDCLVCMQEAAASAMLSSALGAAPPDFPSRAAATGTAVCQKLLANGTSRAIIVVHETLARCELANIGATSPVDCTSEHAAELDAIAATADRQIDRCTETTGLQGCLGGEDADPECLGETARSAGEALAGTSFGVAP
jgi:hypothetical protein